jgi:hypothetical protein
MKRSGSYKKEEYFSERRLPGDAMEGVRIRMELMTRKNEPARNP